jgi:CRP-like cAMP-binding protein
MHGLRHAQRSAGGTSTSAHQERTAVQTLPPLAELELFRGCSAQELAMIDSLSTWIRVRAGRQLCQEGAIGREFFVILYGSVTVQVTGQPTHRLSVGEGFGEMAMLDHGRRVGTVTANEPTELLVFSVAEFDALLVQVPNVARELEGMAAARRRMLEHHEPDAPGAGRAGA